MGFSSDRCYEYAYKIWSLYRFTCSWDNREYPKKLDSPWIRPCSLFSEIFNELLFGWTLWYYSGQIWSSRSSTIGHPYIVTFPPSSRVSKILPLLCSSTPLFPTPPLVPKIFPCSLGVGGWPLDYEERRDWLIVRAIIVSKISKPCAPYPRTSQTDRQSDGQTTCSLNTVLCTAVLCIVR